MSPTRGAGKVDNLSSVLESPGAFPEVSGESVVFRPLVYPLHKPCAPVRTCIDRGNEILSQIFEDGFNDVF